MHLWSDGEENENEEIRQFSLNEILDYCASAIASHNGLRSSRVTTIQLGEATQNRILELANHPVSSVVQILAEEGHGPLNKDRAISWYSVSQFRKKSGALLAKVVETEIEPTSFEKWKDEKVILDNTTITPVKHVYEHYKKYCQDNQLTDILKPRNVSKLLGNLKRTRVNEYRGLTCLVGIKLTHKNIGGTDAN